ncbi:hypothetical protein E2562_011395 [Oryza meyeriana var. granulata]|uniref:Uncharacterized protein n=1 Tax=Oryza meyeriana var. granulata TaxID=110450 RepID=A0A6G1EA34_9ORYZ|nr:hypothetical protein E2562_011395 [Oryza meyeriana var. granulata]
MDRSTEVVASTVQPSWAGAVRPTREGEEEVAPQRFPIKVIIVAEAIEGKLGGWLDHVHQVDEDSEV